MFRINSISPNIIILKVRILLTLILIIWISAIYPQNQRGANALTSSNSAHKGNTRALIIGISEYKNLSPEMQLNYADDDAIAFYNYLIDRPDFIDQENIKMILNENASKREHIESVLENFIINESDANDMVIIYFSGHAAIQNPNAQVDQGYLLLHNAPNDGDYAAPTSDVISINYLQEL